jgi:hypothetical protein
MEHAGLFQGGGGREAARKEVIISSWKDAAELWVSSSRWPGMEVAPSVLTPDDAPVCTARLRVFKASDIRTANERFLRDYL